MQCSIALLLSMFLCGTLAVDYNTADANRTLHLAWSSYCNESALRSWDCEWCTSPFAAKHVQIQTYLKNDKAGTQGYVGIDTDLHQIVVAYRGSKNFQNVVQDAEFFLRSAPAELGFPSKSRVDTGFLEAYLSVRNDTLAGVAAAKKLCANCTVIFTGHSLGSAMSTYGAAEVANIYKTTAVKLYNFGSPRTGNKEFASWAEGLLDSNSIRMRRQLDIVPAIPPRSIGYVHLHTEVWNKHSNGHKDSYVVCDGSGEDEKCGDSEEHPIFPLDLLHLKPSEHTRYMGYNGGGCAGG